MYKFIIMICIFAGSSLFSQDLYLDFLRADNVLLVTNDFTLTNQIGHYTNGNYIRVSEREDTEDTYCDLYYNPIPEDVKIKKGKTYKFKIKTSETENSFVVLQIQKANVLDTIVCHNVNTVSEFNQLNAEFFKIVAPIK